MLAEGGDLPLRGTCLQRLVLASNPRKSRSGGSSLGLSLNVPGGNVGTDAVLCGSRNEGIGDCASAGYTMGRLGATGRCGSR